MAEVNTNCPMCGDPMTKGVMGVNGRTTAWNTVVWEPSNQKLFPKSTKLLWPGFFGGRSRRAWRCESCDCVLLPPDPKQDG
jgi:hypothetical protein